VQSTPEQLPILESAKRMNVARTNHDKSVNLQAICDPWPKHVASHCKSLYNALQTTGLHVSCHILETDSCSERTSEMNHPKAPNPPERTLPSISKLSRPPLSANTKWEKFQEYTE
jgi:hypothetical protein